MCARAGRSAWRGGRQCALYLQRLFKDVLLSREGTRPSSRPPLQMSDETEETNAHLDAEVASVHVVAEEQVAGVAGGSSHLKKLHQVKELAVDISTHWAQKTSWVMCVFNMLPCSRTYTSLQLH